MILAWDNSLVGTNTADVFVQRINSAGAVLWTPNGVALTDLPSRQNIPAVSHLSDGGAIISWNDERGPASAGWFEAVDIFAPRVNAEGVPQWASNGIVVSNAPAPQSNLVAFTLDSDDAVILWLDDRDVFQTDQDIYMQNVHPDGTLGPTSTSVTCCPHENVSLTCATTGASYQWEVDAGSGFVSLGNDANYSGVNSPTLNMTNLPAEGYGYFYHCITDGIAGSKFNLRPVNTWVGSGNSN